MLGRGGGRGRRIKSVVDEGKRENTVEEGKSGLGVGKEKEFVAWDRGRIVSGRNEAEGTKESRESRDGERQRRKERPRNR